MQRAALPRNSSAALTAVLLGALVLGCAFEPPGDEPDQLYAGPTTKQLIRSMAERGKLFVFDKDKTLLGGDTDKTRRLLRLIRDYNADMAVLTSNTTMEGDEYKAIGQLQRKFGTYIFPDAFFETPAFQVNDKVGDRTKANEMGEIIAYFGVSEHDVVFFDDRESNIDDIADAFPGVTGIHVDPDRSMTVADFRRGMRECLAAEPGSGSCAGQCSPSCPCAEGEGDCDRDADCQDGLVCPPNGPGSEQCELPDNGPPSGNARSNLQVRVDGAWRGVCCRRGELEISDADCSWEEHGRRLETRDVSTGNPTELKCPENGQRPADCSCSSTGERMHGISDGDDRHVENSLMLPNGAPIYPNSGHETCVDLTGGELQSRWSSRTCPDWRLLNFY